MHNKEVGWMDKENRYLISYRTIAEDNNIRNSQDFEESTWLLKENDCKGSLVIGYDSLPWNVQSAMGSASA